MKRKLLIMGLIVSSLIFAQEFNNNKNDVKGQGIEMPMGEQSNLTDAQKKELQVLFEKHHKAVAPLMLESEEKDLAIKKELLADKVNWGNVENILKEKSVIEGQIEVQMLKNRLEIQEKFGDTFKFGMNNMENNNGQKMNGNVDNKKMDWQEKDMKKTKIQGNDVNNNSKDKKDGMMNLTEAQQTEVKAIKDKYQKQMSNLRLSEEEKEIAIKKEMLIDKLNWDKIETLTTEKLAIKGQTELLMLQERNEIKSKLGIEFMEGFDKGPQGKFNPENMGNEKEKM